MAWLSIGNSNEDLCQKLIENDVLQPGTILEAFRATDRGDFVAAEDRIQAYTDRPFKKGKLHLSAPHMYATVLQALDLKAGKSFLNVGSGSGYLSCLAAYLLGEEGVSHGVEICEAVCEFSKERAKLWHAKLSNSTSLPPNYTSIAVDGISFVNANCFDIDVLSAVSTFKYDRIYVGAGCPDSRKEFFLSMLADDGILVVPINERNQMLSIRKFYGRVYSIKPISNVNFAPLVDTAVRPDEEEMLQELAAQEVKSLSCDIETSILKVQNAPSASSFIIHPIAAPISALANPGHSPGHSAGPSATASTAPAAAWSTAWVTHRVRLPSLVWAPVRKRHLQFPPEFRNAVFTVLLANNRYQSGAADTALLSLTAAGSLAASAVTTASRSCRTGHHKHGCKCGGCAFLPHQLWLLIFSFANRDWFCPNRSEVQVLSMELAVERRLRRTAEERLRRSEEARRGAERERDALKMAVMRLTRRRRTSSSGLLHHSHGHGGLGLGAFIDLDEGDEEDQEEEESQEQSEGESQEDEEDEDEESQESENEGEEEDQEEALENEEEEESEEEGLEDEQDEGAFVDADGMSEDADHDAGADEAEAELEIGAMLAGEEEGFDSERENEEVEMQEEEADVHLMDVEPALDHQQPQPEPLLESRPLVTVTSNLTSLLRMTAPMDDAALTSDRHHTHSDAPPSASPLITTATASAHTTAIAAAAATTGAACSYQSECTSATGTTCESVGASTGAASLTSHTSWGAATTGLAPHWPPASAPVTTAFATATSSASTAAAARAAALAHATSSSLYTLGSSSGERISDCTLDGSDGSEGGAETGNETGDEAEEGRDSEF